MQLTNKAHTANVILEELKEICNDKIMYGASGIDDKQELADYMYAQKHIISCVNLIQQNLEINFAQEEIDDFYVEQHTNLERLQYTMHSILADDYLTFLTHINNIAGLEDFNYDNAENVAQQARQEGGHFADAYAVCVLEHLKERAYYKMQIEENSSALFICADALVFFVKQLLKLV